MHPGVVIVRRVSSASKFATLIEPVVARNPVGRSILIVSIGRVLPGESVDPDVVWWVREGEGGVVAAGANRRSQIG